MKKVLFFITFFLLVSHGFAQDTIQNTKWNNEPIHLDEVPVFSGCKRKKTEEGKKKCTSKKISRFISREYNVKIYEDLNFPDWKHTAYIIFKIDKKGNIIQAKARGPHPLLEKEAIRVINNLPQMVTGKVKGEPVIIPFSIPIYLSNKVSKNSRKLKIDHQKY